jgi:5,10-methylenetetrahydromethanopterin reductase
MRFGFLLFARDLHTVGPIAQLGEEHGFDLIGMGESPSLAYDPYVALTLAGLNTSRARLGTLVTNPQTRHPLIIANQAATLAELLPGRSFLGLGVGNSGVRHAGAKPASIRHLAEAVAMTRRLLAGESVESDGGMMSLNVGGRAQVPILLAGSGQKSLRLAGRLADVVFISVGATPEAVSDGLKWVAEGANSAGRDPRTIETWAYVDAAIDADGSWALEEVKGAAVSRAAILFSGAAAERLPPAIREKTGQLLSNYDYGQHLMPGRSANYRLAEELGIADYLLERLTIAGSPEDCCRKIERLRAVGIENVCFNLTTAADFEGSLRLMGTEVLRPLRDG